MYLNRCLNVVPMATWWINPRYHFGCLRSSDCSVYMFLKFYVPTEILCTYFWPLFYSGEGSRYSDNSDERAPSVMARAVTVHPDTVKFMYFAWGMCNLLVLPEAYTYKRPFLPLPSVLTPQQFLIHSWYVACKQYWSWQHGLLKISPVKTITNLWHVSLNIE